MTDNQIKEALGYCTSVAYRGVCKDCVYMKFKMTDQGCLTPMLKDALDLINRLEAEIGRQKDYIELLDIEHEAIRMSAYKEFAKELKERFFGVDTYYSGGTIKRCVDILAKEKVGE